MRDERGGGPSMLSVRQVGRALGMNRRQVFTHLRAHTWPGAERLGPRSWRVPAAAVQRPAPAGRPSLAG